MTHPRRGLQPGGRCCRRSRYDWPRCLIHYDNPIQGEDIVLKNLEAAVAAEDALLQTAEPEEEEEEEEAEGFD